VSQELTYGEGSVWVSPQSASDIASGSLIVNRWNSNVGNKIAVFTMQSLGCEVAALNTVQFSQSKLGTWQGNGPLICPRFRQSHRLRAMEREPRHSSRDI
jgi:hypothetical protein